MKRINTIIPFCIFCFLSQCSIAESPINTTKDSHESKPLTESLIESKKDKDSTTQNNTKTTYTLNENLDYLLKDSNTKFPVSDDLVPIHFPEESDYMTAISNLSAVQNIAAGNHPLP